MKFPNVDHINFSIDKVEYHIIETRRAKYIHTIIDFNLGNRNFIYEMKVGKKGKWTEVGFLDDKYSFRNPCPYCGGCYGYCKKFRRNQKKLMRTLLTHEDVLKEIKKIRLKVLTEDGFNILKKACFLKYCGF